MTKARIAYLSLLMALALATSCGKEQSHAPILFSTGDGLEDVTTKAAITTDNLGSNNLMVYAEKDAAAHPNMKPATLTKKGAFWRPSSVVEWEDGHAYSFQGYAYYSKSRIPSVATTGLSFTVTQPNSYSNPANFADFVFSNKVDVPADQSSAHPLINLEFDHVLPAVQVFVTKAEEISDVKVTRIALSGLYYGATMTYSPKDGIWQHKYTTGRTANYINGTETAAGTTAAGTAAFMSVISVPQSFDRSTLTIEYKVDESTDGEPRYHEYSQTFNLSEYGISAGHRAVFNVNIDSGIHLVAQIVKWRKTDVIEGTLLPPIDAERSSSSNKRQR